jgi:hypothetical protein
MGIQQRREHKQTELLQSHADNKRGGFGCERHSQFIRHDAGQLLYKWLLLTPKAAGLTTRRRQMLSQAIRANAAHKGG